MMDIKHDAIASLRGWRFEVPKDIKMKLAWTDSVLWMAFGMLEPAAKYIQ